MFQRLMSQIAAVKKDMVILEKSQFSALLVDNQVAALFIPFFSYSFLPSKGFKLAHLSAEVQDPDSEAQDSAGCRCR